jgi:hypothetical protein
LPRRPPTVTISPPFGELANAAIRAVWLSARSFALIGVSSTACDGAIAWITANWPMPGRRKFTDGDGIDIGKPTVVDPQVAASGAAQGLQRLLERPPSR